MSTQAQARNPEVDELSCVPEPQELILGVEDPLKMSDTEQGDIALETQHNTDSNDEDIADRQNTQASGWTQKGKSKGKGKSKTRKGQHVSEENSDKRIKKPPAQFSAEEEQQIGGFFG